jgi:hypothetical protein
MGRTDCFHFRRIGLTDHGDDEHDEEGVAHGDEGDGEGGEDLLGGLEAAEEAHDAEGAEDADGEVEGAEDDEGHEDDARVEDGPGVGEELADWVREEIEEELHREEGGEDGVEELEQLLGDRRAPVAAEKLFLPHLNLGSGNTEVLHERQSGKIEKMRRLRESAHRDDQGGGYCLKQLRPVQDANSQLHPFAPRIGCCSLSSLLL